MLRLDIEILAAKARSHMSENATTQARFIKSYEIRRAYQGGVEYPPAISGVKGAIDIHCHATRRTKTRFRWPSSPRRTACAACSTNPSPARTAPSRCRRFAMDCNAGPTKKKSSRFCAGPAPTSQRSAPPTVAKVRELLDGGINAIWMPVAMHANTLSKIGGRKSWWDPSAGRGELTPALSWDEALKVGHYALDDKGKLKPVIKDIIGLLHERQVPLFFGHATHPGNLCLRRRMPTNRPQPSGHRSSVQPIRQPEHRPDDRARQRRRLSQFHL